METRKSCYELINGKQFQCHCADAVELSLVVGALGSRFCFISWKDGIAVFEFWTG